MKTFAGNLLDVLFEAYTYINDNDLQEKITAAYLFREKYGWQIVIHFSGD